VRSLLSKHIKIRIYKTIILPVVLYGCETSSLTLREEHRLRVFENRVLRRIFTPKRNEVTGDWRKLHNEEIHSFIPRQTQLDLNIRSLDLNQLAASRLELPRKRSGTGRTDITKNIGNPQLDSNRQRDLYQGPLPEERRIC
jgi:hypothetical protein